MNNFGLNNFGFHNYDNTAADELLDIGEKLLNNDWCFSNIPQYSLRIYMNKPWWRDNRDSIIDLFNSGNVKRLKIIHHYYSDSDCIVCQFPDLETKFEFILGWS